eukprot:scaffold30130_cov32-Phaeocystis_antarctica.AAC.1
MKIPPRCPVLRPPVVNLCARARRLSERGSTMTTVENAVREALHERYPEEKELGVAAASAMCDAEAVARARGSGSPS